MYFGITALCVASRGKKAMSVDKFVTIFIVCRTTADRSFCFVADVFFSPPNFGGRLFDCHQILSHVRW